MSARAKSKRVPRLVAAVLLLGVLAVCTGYFWVRWYRAPQWEVHEVVGWLPEDTEMVSCIEGPWPLEPKHIDGTSSLAHYLEAGPTAFPQFDPELRKKLEGRQVLLSVEARRKLIKRMPFQGASIIVFDKGLGWAGFSQAARISDLPIAIPRANVLIVATDRQYLEEVLNRIERTSAGRRLPDFFDDSLRRLQGARFWAARRCDAASEAIGADPEARGIHFRYDPGRSPIARLTYFSTNSEALLIASEFWSRLQEGRPPEVKRLSPGELEMSIRDDAAAGQDIGSLVLTALGY